MRTQNPLGLKGSLSRGSVSLSLMSFSLSGGFQAHSSSSTIACAAAVQYKSFHINLYATYLKHWYTSRCFSGAFCHYFFEFLVWGVLLLLFWGLLVCLLIYHRMVSVGRATKIIHFQPCAMDGNSFHENKLLWV